MRKTIAIFLLLLFQGISSYLIARDYPPGFLSDGQMPDGALLLPPPPADSSCSFATDLCYYEWGKTQRTSTLAQRFRWEEEGEIYIAFSESIGLEISETNTPEIENLCLRATTDMWKFKNSMKQLFRRQRPFTKFGEPSLLPDRDEHEARGNSYPSGHSAMGFLNAMVLAQMVPDSTVRLLKRAHEYALDRVIAGTHYKSDIDASMTLATAVFIALQQNEDYQRQLATARREYLRLKALSR